MAKRLNLDALYGHEPIEVEWQGQVYEMRNLKSLGPQELARFERLYERAQGLLGTDAENLSDEQAAELDRIVRETMRIICPALADLPFLLLSKALMFYGEQVTPSGQDKDTDEKKSPQ